MASAIEFPKLPQQLRLEDCLSQFADSVTSHLCSVFSPFPNVSPKHHQAMPNNPGPLCKWPTKSSDCMPFVFPPPSPQILYLMLGLPVESFHTNSSDSWELAPSELPRTPGRLPASNLRIIAPSSRKKVGGPAFVGQVFSMCDLTGTGLMAVSTHFDIPFISRRTPDWIKKIFANIMKSERNGPMFRFFLDLSDAVAYVKRLNIPSAVVGSCRLDLAYEYFKEKPHLFQLVPNEKQVKAAEKLLKKKNIFCGSRERICGVPVFSSRNLDIAIAAEDGIKWYTPYFFDKNMLDNILDESVDQQFRALIKSRCSQRWKEVVDDNLTAEMAAEMSEVMESLWEPPEIEEMMSEIGSSALPIVLGAISKAAEMQFSNAVDEVLLGNKWLRKAIGVQPEFPYMVDSFENRSSASLIKSQTNGSVLTSPERSHEHDLHSLGPSESKCLDKEGRRRDSEMGRFLPKVTMLGISKSESDKLGKASFKKRMEELMKRLKHINHAGSELGDEERDPLFVANVGDFSSRFGKMGMGRWVRSADVQA